MATTIDVLGGSSYLWHWKHAVFHHSYVNIAGHDTDINLGIFARLTPHQKRLMFHWWQYLSAFGIPLLFHRANVVLFYYLVASLVLESHTARAPARAALSAMKWLPPL